MNDPDDPDFNLQGGKTSMVPWILFVLALVGGGAGFYIEMQKADTEAAKVTAAQKSSEDARAKVADLEKAKTTLEARVQELEAEKAKMKAAPAAAAAPAGAAPADAKGGKKDKHHKKHH